jgi:hypothetical protein
MTHHAGRIFHPYSVDLPVLMASQTRVLLRAEGMNRSLVAVLAGKFLDIDVTGVSR